MNYILRNENAIYYECDYSCDHALYLQMGSEGFLITDARYTQEAKEQSNGCEVVESADLIKSARKIIKDSNIKEILYDPNDFTVTLFKDLTKKLNISFIEEKDYSAKKRMVKSDDEIELISKAVNMGQSAFDDFALFIIEEGIGKTEKYLQYEAKRILSRHGELDLSFDPIVAIGSNASKPHALPTKKRLNNGELLLFDAGVKYKRYCSDRTRTVTVNKSFSFDNMQQFSSTIQSAYDAVKRAHDKAIQNVRSGMSAKAVDALTRDEIEKAGFGKYFVHSTGHGVGLDIHEHPYISKKSETIIEDNMVFTVEPGIYIPGEFGIRIEDMVVMRDSKAEIL